MILHFGLRVCVYERWHMLSSYRLVSGTQPPLTMLPCFLFWTNPVPFSYKTAYICIFYLWFFCLGTVDMQNMPKSLYFLLIESCNFYGTLNFTDLNSTIPDLNSFWGHSNNFSGVYICTYICVFRPCICMGDTQGAHTHLMNLE